MNKIEFSHLQKIHYFQVFLFSLLRMWVMGISNSMLITYIYLDLYHNLYIVIDVHFSSNSMKPEYCKYRDNKHYIQYHHT